MNTNASSPRIASNGEATGDVQDGTTLCNGRNKNEEENLKFKRPLVSAFHLLPPPPPKMATTMLGTVAANESHYCHISESIDDLIDNENSTRESINLNSNTGRPHSVAPAPTVPVPPAPTYSSTVYQRVNRKLYLEHSDSSTTNAQISFKKIDPSTDIKSCSQNSHMHVHRSQLRYPPYTNKSHFSSPYQPSSWYKQARAIHQKRQIAQKIILIVSTILVSALVWRGLLLFSSNTEFKSNRRHHKNYHHHEHRTQTYHFHPMLGIIESPLGFAKEVSQIEDNRFGSTHDIFSTFPVVTLNNNRLLPLIGFGVASQSVEHKEIPSIVSTLLNYASSETEGGGGIAMLDAVMDCRRRDDSNLLTQYDNEQRTVQESSSANIVLALVGRAVMFFGKERIKTHPKSSFLTKGENASAVGHDTPYEYSNRLEIHLLVGISDPDLGVENTIGAMRYFFAEMDGIVPPLPINVHHKDPSKWTMPPSTTISDHRLDVRLHLLIHLKGCQDEHHDNAPCSSNERMNEELLQKYVDTYAFLEKLYTANFIHGIGLDSIHSADISYLLKNSKVTPQLYRGDVSQALDFLSNDRRRVQKREDDLAIVLKENGITFLASNVAGHILEKSTLIPNAYALLQNLGGVLYRSFLESLQSDVKDTTVSHNGEAQYFTVPRLVLSYLVREGICVLPHAYKAEHLADDAPESVAGLAKFLSERRAAEIGFALKALLSGHDIPEDHGLGMEGEDMVAVSFYNKMVDEIYVTRVGSSSQEVVLTIMSGDYVLVTANTGDNYVAYGYDGQQRGAYTILADSRSSVEYYINEA